jgi:Tfp pilus assembly protein PilV
MDPIIGALAALVISMFGVVGFTQFAKMGVSNIQTAATASQQQAFDAATQQYVQDNAATLAQSATAAVPVTITAAQLATAGYLPAGYLGTNSFGQTWQAQVLQPTAGQLETLVTSTGGNSITDTKQLAQIAAETGAAGGFVPYANQAGTAFNTNAAYGTYGS